MKNKISVFKEILILSTISIILSCTMQEETNQFNNILSIDNLNGPVKGISVFTSGPEGKEYLEKIKKYNPDGFTTQYERYSMAGDLLYSSSYNINSENEIKENIIYEIDSGKSKHIYTYENGNINEIKYIPENEKDYTATIRYIYDKNNNPIKIINNSSQGKILTEIDYVYSDDNEIINKIEEHNNNGKISTIEYINTYENGKIRQQLITFTPSSGWDSVKTEFEYNRKNQLIKRISYENNIIVREKNYNEKGLIAEIIYYKNGEFDHSNRYMYKYDRNQNWINKEIHYKSSSDFKYGLLSNERREIEYY